MSDNMEKPKKDDSFIESMAENLMKNYIIPGTTNIMHDMFSGFVNMLSGTAQAGIDNSFKKIGWNGVNKINPSNTGTSYNKMFIAGGSKPVTSSTLSVVSRDKNNIRNIFLDSEQQVKDLFDNLQDICGRYNRVTVLALYNQFVPPIPSNGNFMLNNIGWTAEGLSKFSYRKIYNDEFGSENKGKFKIDFPAPINIQNI